MLHYIIFVYIWGGALAAFTPWPDEVSRHHQQHRQFKDADSPRRSSQKPLITPIVSKSSRIRLSAAPDSKQLARQLYNENVMPIDHDSTNPIKSTMDHLVDGYDKDETTPLESEFRSLMATFLTYSERDVRSLTSTSSRYLVYAKQNEGRKQHIRSKETGIRYRALFEGVQRCVIILRTCL